MGVEARGHQGLEFGSLRNGPPHAYSRRGSSGSSGVGRGQWLSLGGIRPLSKLRGAGGGVTSLSLLLPAPPWVMHPGPAPTWPADCDLPSPTSPSPPAPHCCSCFWTSSILPGGGSGPPSPRLCTCSRTPPTFLCPNPAHPFPSWIPPLAPPASPRSSWELRAVEGCAPGPQQQLSVVLWLEGRAAWGAGGALKCDQSCRFSPGSGSREPAVLCQESPWGGRP